jgi:hypothetical protein
VACKLIDFRKDRLAEADRAAINRRPHPGVSFFRTPTAPICQLSFVFHDPRSNNELELGNLLENLRRLIPTKHILCSQLNAIHLRTARVCSRLSLIVIIIACVVIKWVVVSHFKIELQK